MFGTTFLLISHVVHIYYLLDHYSFFLISLVSATNLEKTSM